MASFVLVPGAGGMAWYWHRAVPLIRAAGHEPIAVELPGDDRHAGLAVYADIVIRAIEERSDVVLVAQSLAGFHELTVCTTSAIELRFGPPPLRSRDIAQRPTRALANTNHKILANRTTKHLGDIHHGT